MLANHIPSPNSPAMWSACFECHANYPEAGRVGEATSSHSHVAGLGEGEVAAEESCGWLERGETLAAVGGHIVLSAQLLRHVVAQPDTTSRPDRALLQDGRRRLPRVMEVQLDRRWLLSDAEMIRRK
jgi:hypothetical protein